MLITGTFLDEITADIPHQNWGEKEWDREFATMKMAGIDTVIMIRCGNQRFITYPSEYLMEKRGAYRPPLDLVDIFLRLADKYSIDFYFGLYDGGCMRKAWFVGSLMSEVDDCKFVAEEVWKRYGHHKSFKGWYLNHEIGIGDGELYILDERTEYDSLQSSLPIFPAQRLRQILWISQCMISCGTACFQHCRELLILLRSRMDIVNTMNWKIISRSIKLLQISMA